MVWSVWTKIMLWSLKWQVQICYQKLFIIRNYEKNSSQSFWIFFRKNSIFPFLISISVLFSAGGTSSRVLYPAMVLSFSNSKFGTIVKIFASIFIIGGTKWCNCGALVVFGAMVVQFSVMVVQLSVMLVKWYNNQLLYQIIFFEILMTS